MGTEFFYSHTADAERDTKVLTIKFLGEDGKLHVQLTKNLTFLLFYSKSE